VEDKPKGVFLSWILPVGLVTMGLQYAYSWLAYALAAQVSQFSLLELWCGWDGKNYLDIAKNGYIPVGDNQTYIAFFPLYPLLIRVLHFIISSWNACALLIANAFYFLSLYWLYGLARFDFEEKDCKRAILWFSIFPTAYFLHAAYTESLFVALAAGSMLYLRQGKILTTCILTALTCFSRPHGIIIVPALLAECFLIEGFVRAPLNRSAIRNAVIIMGGGIVGFGAYLEVNQYVYHTPFKFLEVQSSRWGRGFDFPWTGFLAAVRRLTTDKIEYEIMISAFELVAAFAGLAAIIYGFRKLRPSFTIYLITGWLLVVCNRYWLSQPRHLLCLFPLFFLLAIGVKREITQYAVATSFLLLQALFLSQFVQWHWAF
jgi:hypothetical protein